MAHELDLVARAELARHYHQPLAEINALDDLDRDILQRWMRLKEDVLARERKRWRSRR